MFDFRLLQQNRREADIESELARWDCPQNDAVRVSALPGANCAFGSTIGAASLSGVWFELVLSHAVHEFSHFGGVRIFLGSGREGEPAKDGWSPGGHRIFGALEPSTGSQGIVRIRKMGKTRALDRTGLIAIYIK